VIRGLDIQEFDHALETKVRMLATLALREEHALEINFADEFMPEFEVSDNPEYFQFRLVDGTVIERSDLLGEGELPLLLDGTGGPEFMNFRLPDGRRGRLVQLAFTPRAGDKAVSGTGNDGHFQIPESADPETCFVVLSFARSREDLDRLLTTVYGTLALVDLVLLVLIGLLVHRSMLRGFEPVAAMNAQIHGLDPEALNQRVHLPEAPLELQPMLSALNLFIEKLQAAFTREHRFSNDVAHELRTPVAEFRAACEVGAKWSDDPQLVARRFSDLAASAVRMERIVNNLLAIARCDRGLLTLQKADVGLAALVDTCWTRSVSEAGGSVAHFDNRVDTALVWRTDGHLLEMLIQNLLGNAISYSLPGTPVLCTSRVEGQGIHLDIRNQTDLLHRDDLAHVFERFWRKDSARTGAQHSGLGLSIVKELSELLGIGLGIDLSDDGVFTVDLFWPLSGTGPV